jgi:glycosyltransferase involved in cell wall biosynthesis
MRVLMVSGIYPLAGSSIVIENLAAQLCKKGVDVTIGALAFKRIPPNEDYNVTMLPVYNLLKLKKFLDTFDIVHSHHPLANYLAIFNRKHFVYHYHGAPNFGRGYLFRLSMISSIKLMKHAFDAVIAVSESGAAELKHYFGIDNVHIIYNGVDTDLFKPRLEQKFRKGVPQFLFVGNFYAHKNVEELILAMNELVKLYPKAYLQIVGYGQSYKFLKRFITKLKLEDHVELVGRVSSLELPYYYASCDVYATASRWELFGLPLLEAIACGKPVVASSIPPHVELINKSKAGETYTEGNIESLWKVMIETYEQSYMYRDYALHFAKEHDWSVVADKVLNIYVQK